MPDKGQEQQLQSVASLARTWRAINVVDGEELRKRWISRSDEGFDPLSQEDRFDEEKKAWIVRDTYELVRLTGALQFWNPKCSLWFRGESSFHKHARPLRYRNAASADRTTTGLSALIKAGQKRRLLRDRSRIALVAILQHYGLPTSFLDVTKDFRAAAYFAFWNLEQKSQFTPPELKEEQPTESYILVFATPRCTDAVNYFHEAGVTVVDLAAEMPSYCLRTHVQQAAFLGLSEAIALDLEQREIGASPADLDDLCIARIRLELTADRDQYEIRSEEIYPPASIRCRLCKPEEQDDWEYDTLLHALDCMKTQGGAGPEIRNLVGFPSFFWMRGSRCAHGS